MPLLDRDLVVSSRPYHPPGGWPARVGALVPVGGLSLSSPAPGFGGFSAMSIARGRMLLLSDQGNWLGLAIVGGRLTALRNGYLPSGPGAGWLKADRDSESLVRDRATGGYWVGFENANQIWRFTPGLKAAVGGVRPDRMRKWRSNSGVEAMVSLADGRFVAIAEGARAQERHRAILFSGDPVAKGTTAATFRFRPPTGFRPSDAALLPGGDVLILTRRFELPFRFRAKLVRVAASAFVADATVSGREIATLDDVVRENCEALAITRAGGHTYIWIATDNDQMAIRPSLILKFRLTRG